MRRGTAIMIGVLLILILGSAFLQFVVLGR